MLLLPPCTLGNGLRTGVFLHRSQIFTAVSEGESPGRERLQPNSNPLHLPLGHWGKEALSCKSAVHPPLSGGSMPRSRALLDTAATARAR